MTMTADPTTAPVLDGHAAMLRFVLDLVDATRAHGRVEKIRPADDVLFIPGPGVRIDAHPIVGDRGAAIFIESGHLSVLAVYSAHTRNWAA